MTSEIAAPAVTGQTGVPSGLVDAVLHLVSTGPVPLGGYTLAEMVAVDAVVDFLDAAPSEEAVGEAVRSLAARELLVTTADASRLQVRGDLGIALAFQQRARVVVDTRVTGTPAGRPWRTLLLPQAEGATLEILVDALGVHELSLRETDQAYERLAERLPAGETADPDNGAADGAADAEGLLADAESSALVTVTRFRAEGAAETAEQSTDVVLARRDGRLQVLARDPDQPDRLVGHRLDRDGAVDLVRQLAAPPPAERVPTPEQGPTPAADAPDGSGLSARARQLGERLTAAVQRRRGR